MSQSPAPQTQTPSKSPEYASGGDITLCSSDGVEFSVHSVILTLASPVFADMFRVGTKGAVVDVSENSEMLTMMLGFLYPRAAPAIASFETLDTAFRIADKYSLESMTNLLRDRLSQHNSPVSVYSDPLRGLALASTYGFAAEASLASSLAASIFDFRNIDHLLTLAKAIPQNRATIRLIGLPLLRVTILVDVLFQYHKSPMSDIKVRKSNNRNPEYIICSSCQATNSGDGAFSPPEWKAVWASSAFHELARHPIEESEHVFRFQFLQTAMAQSSGRALNICECVKKLSHDTFLFHLWAAEHVRGELVRRLAAIHPLDAIA